LHSCSRTTKKPINAILFFPPFVQENVNYYLQRDDTPFVIKREIIYNLIFMAGATGLKNLDQQTAFSYSFASSKLIGMCTDIY